MNISDNLTKIILAIFVLIGAAAFITISIKKKNKQSNIKIGRDGDVVGGDKKVKNVK
jgi:hypothetical protein